MPGYEDDAAIYIYIYISQHSEKAVSIRELGWFYNKKIPNLKSSTLNIGCTGKRSRY